MSQFKSHPALPIAPVVRCHLRGLIRDHVLYNGQPNAAARWHLMGVLDGQYHRKDFGKIVAVEWSCSKCGGTWDHSPKRHEHKNCSYHPSISKGECLSCESSWSNDPTKKEPEAVHVERQGSLIHVSHAYLTESEDYEFRIWGWIPPRIRGDVQREDVLNFLAQAMGWRSGSFSFSKGVLWSLTSLDAHDAKVISWREFNSNRDSTGKVYTDPSEFLCSSVVEEEKSK